MESTSYNLSKPSILLVDDEERVLNAVRRNLNAIDSSLNLITASKGRDALKIIERERIGLVISDLRMPEKDGTAVLSSARRTQPEALRIILSGQASTDMLLSALPSSHRYVEKPCSSLHLRSILELYAMIVQSELPPALIKHLLTFSSLPVDGLLCQVLKRTISPKNSVLDTTPVTADLGLHLAIIRLGVIVYGERFSAKVLPLHLFHPLMESSLLMQLKSSEEILNALRLVSIKAKLLENRIKPLLLDAELAPTVAARAYLGEYVLVTAIGAEHQFSAFIKKHRQRVGDIMSSLWGLPESLTRLATSHATLRAQREIDGFLPLSDVSQLSATELISMLSEVVCLNEF